jgi:hypothetical protein
MNQKDEAYPSWPEACESPEIGPAEAAWRLAEVIRIRLEAALTKAGADKWGPILNSITRFLNEGPLAEGRAPTGKCVYGGGQCVENTRSECQGLQGRWTEGETCSHKDDSQGPR